MLTVTDASGSTASVTQSLVVKAPSITKVSVTKGAKTEKLKVALSGPGDVEAGVQEDQGQGSQDGHVEGQAQREAAEYPEEQAQADGPLQAELLAGRW